MDAKLGFVVLAGILAGPLAWCAEPDQPDLTHSLAVWKQANGPEWRLDVDTQTGFARMLYGGHSAAPVYPGGIL